MVTTVSKDPEDNKKLSRVSFAEKDGNESTESAQIPIKKMKSLKKTIQTCCFTEGQSSWGYKYQWQQSQMAMTKTDE